MAENIPHSDFSRFMIETSAVDAVIATLSNRVVAIGTSDSLLRLYLVDVSYNVVFLDEFENEGAVREISVSSDGTHIACLCGPNNVVLYSRVQGAADTIEFARVRAITAEFPNEHEVWNSIALLSSSTVGVGCGGSVSVYDYGDEADAPVRSADIHDSEIVSMKYCEATGGVVSADVSGRVVVWNAIEMVPIFETRLGSATEPSFIPQTLSVSNDGSSVALVMINGAVAVYDYALTRRRVFYDALVARRMNETMCCDFDETSGWFVFPSPPGLLVFNALSGDYLYHLGQHMVNYRFGRVALYQGPEGRPFLVASAVNYNNCCFFCEQ